jgi:carbamoyl-phosphate synthase large subunit
MEKKTVVVTGIGGNVGQGIIRNLRNSGLPLHIIGTNVTDFSPGNHLVDSFFKVPFAYDEGYTQAIAELVEQQNVDLVIPSTDYEVYYLSVNAAQLACPAATSGSVAAEAYLDKYLTFLHHQKFGIAFSESYLPSLYTGQFEKAIAKPRKGRGSRGLLKLNFDTSLLTDEEYMVQEMHEGDEITTAVYRSYLDGEILGLITMVRSLENGATTYSKVVKQYDEQMLFMAQKMAQNSDLRGSFNIQSIVTASDDIIPFEVNCRISGTNSIRTHFGFADVEYTVRELLYGQQIQAPKITYGIAHRILMDVIYPNAEHDNQLKGTSTDNFILF